MCARPIYFFFFFNDTATTEIYTLSLHDASSDLLCAFFIHKGKVFILFLYIVCMMAEAAIILAYLLSQLLLMCVMHIEIKFEFRILHFNCFLFLLMAIS